MSLAQATRPQTPSPQRAEFERYRLRAFLAALGRDEVEVHGAPIELADIAQALEGNPKAVLFGAAGPERAELVGNVMGSRARIARAFGVAPAELLPEIQRRLAAKSAIVEVAREEAPVQEVVLTGESADLTALPVHLQHGADGG